MKKQLPAHDIANELAASSVFFPSKDSAQPSESPVETPQAAANVHPRHHAPTVSSHHATTTPRHRDSEPPSDQPEAAQEVDEGLPSNRDQGASPETLEEVRRIVKQLGKEAATYRFSTSEKRAIADLVYTYHRQGYRTSENEITRIAVNWLLADYGERGEQSILAQMLDLLHG